MKTLITTYIILFTVIVSAQTQTSKLQNVNFTETHVSNLKIELDVDSLKELENAFNIEKLEKMLEETANKGEVEFKITCNKPAVKPNGVKRKISYNIKSENLETTQFIKMAERIYNGAKNYYLNE
ncbi:hypothetical protein [Lacinutrix sp. 5H-3-7-4]|uniref:hypothetical protein n=1 Tax=Lacinutrix sp. (strain 5H-3-7-4) TaxID=983544 RepID=UPI00020A3799|nr:hypothetical protein [Lacinutrix sp. 5H-3-7-4]AEH00324.1 hypothetical protein Lacal_0472 [Lacinutrix sp. 5H-3-7-4]